jgi:hypothetical protein
MLDDGTTNRRHCRGHQKESLGDGKINQENGKGKGKFITNQHDWDKKQISQNNRLPDLRCWCCGQDIK